MKELREVSYIFEIKIYRDRSKRLLGLSQFTYIETILKWFNIENFKKDYRPIGYRIFLLKKDCPITPQERECMSRILYTSTMDFIMYVMTCTRPNVAYSLGVVSRYQSDIGETIRRSCRPSSSLFIVILT